MTELPFGRVLTAMVTPFAPDDSVNYEEARQLAAYLVDVQRNDALVVNGTTGESPTTTDDEKRALLEAVVDEVGDRAKVIAGVGTFDTRHTVELAHQAQQAGAHGLLVVTPYYSRPPQDALAAHFLTVADDTDLPIVIYDIPHRTGVPVETATMIQIAAHDRIVAVKDAKGLPVQSAQVIAQTNLAYYAGDDGMVLPLLSVGGVGVVGTSTHFTGAATRGLIESYLAGDVEAAVAAYQALLPVYTGVFATQGCMLVKAGLAARGFHPGGCRPPLLEATEEQTAAFVALLNQAGF
ncbi:MAG: 4-hydroxy-tetrahydrodipicolinate synthase [Propionicimonas sp.]|uniref:4-hydroxy-tetrahydrodipicolinate synthase n=1 Tax=Propionicimonas sp. TaxID=1955623 RepID=UPI002B1FDC09|nr:4-hydroxy-tetrahydrodipicolinate synthase [Propionicimonas sp.]MEA4944252.1 4-hydroxy-tetrahydrodipicolinate synthase [Propionicimonas sp.]MEA5054058.1 4-hydroxy-tetrahydrodipicolinate synthase [Propionicimonas sp.]